MRVSISYQYNGQPTIKFFRKNKLHEPLLDSDFARLWASFNKFLLHVTTVFKDGKWCDGGENSEGLYIACAALSGDGMGNFDDSKHNSQSVILLNPGWNDEVSSVVGI